jgi:hypothetical protein
MRTLPLLMLAGALVLPAPAAAALAGHSAPPAMSATGTLEHYDAASRMLTLKTKKGDETFVVSDATTVHRGSKAATAAQLASWNGQPVKVRYSEAGGLRTASSVMVGGTHHHEAAVAANQHPAATPK